MYNADKYRNKAVRSKPLQDRGKERVRVILAAALELFKERGYAEVTTNDIAQRAKVPIGSLYRYYPNKESILAALTELYIEDVSKVFDDIAKHPMLRHLSWEEVLFLMVDGWVSYSRLNGPFSFLYAERANPRLHEQNYEAWLRFITKFVRVLKTRCPKLSNREALIGFNLCFAAVDMGVNSDWVELCGSDMYHEGVRVAANYMRTICGSSDHHALAEPDL